MKLFKSKLAFLSPIIVLVVVLVFGLTLIPSVQPTPKNLPIVFVNEDQGVDIPNQGKVNMGKTIAGMIQKTAQSTSGEEPAVKFISASSYQEAIKGLDNRDYYAALVIPKDFSRKQASLRGTQPISPEIEIVVNQGINTAGSTMAGTVLNGIVDQMNTNFRTQLLTAFEKQGGTVTTKQAAAFVSPITKKVSNVNETGTNSMNGNAPISLFQPLWMASIAGAVIIFLTLSKVTFATRKEKFSALFAQVLMGAVIALVAGFGLTWMADAIGVHISQFGDIALFLSLSCYSFFLMISAVLSWTGIKGVPIFVIMLFFGAPLLAMAPEFMSPFYRDWINPWLPIRFLVEGLRDLFFFGKNFSWNHPTSVLTWIAAGSMVVIFASVLKFRSKQEEKSAAL
ncbi:ABC transporter permease [Neobacillus drentensis]|uniref:YhgE/Pip domain-containing protein n=1 Tax=Neobacillus drentensis TaxID=220684 RepID=UPI002FFFBA81